LPIVSPIDGTTADDATYSFIGTEDYGFNVSAPGSLYAGSTASEMAHLFHNTLGILSYCDLATSTTSSCNHIIGAGVYNPGLFNLRNGLGYYWSSTDYAPDTSQAWGFGFGRGEQSHCNKDIDACNADAWAVHDGDVGSPVQSLLRCGCSVAAS
jgi:hypothetical protein